MADGRILKELEEDTKYLRGRFIILNNFPREDEYYRVLDELLVDVF
jgi:hypothetical protein